MPAKLFGMTGVPVLSVTMSPLQIVPSLGVVPELSVTVMLEIGSGLTVMTFVAVFVQPRFVTVRVYVVVTLGETVIELVVAPLLQE